jgi:hypothetical protein
MLASNGVTRARASNASNPNRTPARRAIAIRWMIALVDPPSANTVVIALPNAAAVSRSDSFTSSQTIATIRRPVCAAITACRESAAGIDAAPGNVTPNASAALVIVEAVPIVMQCPGERAMPFSISCQSASVIAPARRSAQYRQVSDPDPNVVPPQCPRSIGPAGMKIVGRSIDAAPISIPGVVLSQPPINTAPSHGYERSNSSVSMANRLRYSIVVGF